jgi:hypothetical protein
MRRDTAAAMMARAQKQRDFSPTSKKEYDFLLGKIVLFLPFHIISFVFF